jgi:hypothetical protein
VKGSQKADEILASIPRDDWYELRVMSRTFQGRQYVDIRLWQVLRSGMTRPTPKGVQLRPSELREVIAALQQAMDALGEGDDVEAA